MKFPKAMYTNEQKAWCANYAERTRFDPMMDDYEAGNVTFYEAAMKAARWYEDHSSDPHQSISDNIPGSLGVRTGT